jgi:hypothetical protein
VAIEAVGALADSPERESPGTLAAIAAEEALAGGGNDAVAFALWAVAAARPSPSPDASPASDASPGSSPDRFGGADIAELASGSGQMQQQQLLQQALAPVPHSRDRVRSSGLDGQTLQRAEQRRAQARAAEAAEAAVLPGSDAATALFNESPSVSPVVSYSLGKKEALGRPRKAISIDALMLKGAGGGGAGGGGAGGGGAGGAGAGGASSSVFGFRRRDGQILAPMPRRPSGLGGTAAAAPAAQPSPARGAPKPASSEARRPEAAAPEPLLFADSADAHRTPVAAPKRLGPARRAAQPPLGGPSLGPRLLLAPLADGGHAGALLGARRAPLPSPEALLMLGGGVPRQPSPPRRKARAAAQPPLGELDLAAVGAAARWSPGSGGPEEDDEDLPDALPASTFPRRHV